MPPKRIPTRFSLLDRLSLTYPHEIDYHSRALVIGFYFGSFLLIACLTLVNGKSPLLKSFSTSKLSIPFLILVILGGYDTTVVLQTDPNVTHYDRWWAPKSLPSSLRLRTKPGDCEPTKLLLDVTFRTNSTLTVFPYRKLRSSIIFIVSNLRNGLSELQNSYIVNDEDSKRYRRDVNVPYQANPLSSCVVSSMIMIVETAFAFFKFSVCTPFCLIRAYTSNPLLGYHQM
jgi:hypothetical protein